MQRETRQVLTLQDLSRAWSGGLPANQNDIAVSIPRSFDISGFDYCPLGYPEGWARHVVFNNGQEALIRPIRADDELRYAEFMHRNEPEDMRLRFLTPLKELPPEMVKHQVTHVDYNRSMAFVAIDPDTEEIMGVSCYDGSRHSFRAEYGLMTRSDLKRNGIGRLLMSQLIAYARTKQIEEIWGEVATENTAMVAMCRKLGFIVHVDPDDFSLFHVRLPVKN